MYRYAVVRVHVVECRKRDRIDRIEYMYIHDCMQIHVHVRVHGSRVAQGKIHVI